MALFLAPQVAAELDEIWYYVARESGNPQIADRLIDFHHGTFLPVVDSSISRPASR